MCNTITEKSFQTEYGNIVYWTQCERPGGITLVFLPGLSADHRLFARQTAYFENRYNLLVWDAPGHGGSRPFRLEFSLMDKAAWLHDILKTENIEAPLLIGQSMGGYVAQYFMQKYPGSVRGFVSIDSAPLKRKYVTAAEIWLLKRCEPVYRHYPWKALQKEGSRGCSTTPFGQKLMIDMMNSYTREEYSRLVGHGYRMLAEAMEADLPYNIDCPAILLCGDHDRAGSTQRYNRKWTRCEGIPIFWIKGAGHNSNTDKPDEVNAIIQEFITNEHTGYRHDRDRARLHPNA